MEEPTDQALHPSRPEFEALVRDANAGDMQALEQLRLFLDQWPEITQRLGDLAEHVQLAIISKIAGNNRLLAESISRKLDELRAELLGGTAASPMERLAIERIIACWLHVQSVDATYPSIEGHSLQTARFVLQLRESSQRRFDAALKSLATLRRLLAETPAAKRATLLRVHAGA